MTQTIEEKHNSAEFLPLMIEIARLMRPKIYMELGVRRGITFQRIAPLAEYAIAVDKERGQIPEIIRRGNLKKAVFFKMTTDEFSEFWAKNPRKIDMLFIDADHRKEQVLRDFDHFGPWMREETGLVFLHDTLPANEKLLSSEYCSSAWQAAAEIRNSPRYREYEILTIPGNWVGLSILRKSRKQLYWMK